MIAAMDSTERLKELIHAYDTDEDAKFANLIEDSRRELGMSDPNEEDEDDEDEDEDEDDEMNGSEEDED